MTSPTADSPLAGRTVLVTGGSSGIGRACAQRYRTEGATVFVADLHPRSSDEIAFDVADPQAWAALVDSLPPLDVVHLNAGITTPGRERRSPGGAPMAGVTPADYRAIVGVNLDGVYFGAQAVLPAMVERGEGQVLVTASMAGLGAMAGDVAYAATKHAVVGLVKSIGSTLEQSGTRGVCISALCPGFVDTPIVPDEAKAFIGQMGLPVIAPERVAEAAVQALTERVNGSQWIVWGDIIRRHEPTPIDLGA